MTTKDWEIKVYGYDDRVMGSWVIEQRTEFEAYDEAVAGLREYPECLDWSMDEVKGGRA